MERNVDLNQLSGILRELVPQKGKSITAVADQLGISSQLLGQYMAGRHMPKPVFYLAWRKVFGEDLLTMMETNVSREKTSMVEESPAPYGISQALVNLTETAKILASANHILGSANHHLSENYKELTQMVRTAVTGGDDARSFEAMAEKERFLQRKIFDLVGSKKWKTFEAQIEALSKEFAEHFRDMSEKGKAHLAGR